MRPGCYSLHAHKDAFKVEEKAGLPVMHFAAGMHMAVLSFFRSGIVMEPAFRAFLLHTFGVDRDPAALAASRLRRLGKECPSASNNRAGASVFQGGSSLFRAFWASGHLGITVGCWGTELGPPLLPQPPQNNFVAFSNLHRHLHSRRFGTPGTGKDRQGSWAAGIALSKARQICRQSTLMVPEL